MTPFPVLIGFLYFVRQPPYKRVIRHLSGHIVQKCLQFLAYVIQAAVCIQEYFCCFIPKRDVFVFFAEVRKSINMPSSPYRSNGHMKMM